MDSDPNTENHHHRAMIIDCGSNTGGSTYSTGTVTQNGTTITGAGGATFTASMVNGIIVFATGATATITGFTSATVLTADRNQYVTAGTAYVITYGAAVKKFLYTAHQGFVGATQIFFTGYYIRNNSAENVKIQIQSQSFEFEGPIINTVDPDSAVNTDKSFAGSGFYLSIPPLSISRKELTTIEPLLTPGSKVTNNPKFNVTVSDWNGNGVAYDRLTLFLIAEFRKDKAPGEQRFSKAMGFRGYDGTF